MDPIGTKLKVVEQRMEELSPSVTGSYGAKPMDSIRTNLKSTEWNNLNPDAMDNDGQVDH